MNIFDTYAKTRCACIGLDDNGHSHHACIVCSKSSKKCAGVWN